MDTLLLQLDDPPTTGTFNRGDAGYRAASPAAATNLAAAFAAVARARADHPAVATKAGEFSYGWLLGAAECVRRYLCSRPNYAAGARIALQLSNSPEYLAAYYGVLLADCVVVPLPVSLEGRRWLLIQERCRPDLLISRAEDFDAQERGGLIAMLRIPNSDGEAITPSAPRRRGDDLAMLLFTSGSTGLPKGVMLSSRNLLTNADSIMQELPICAEDRALVTLPFCHAYGNSILQTHVLSGATLLLNGTLTFPASVVEALHETKATSFSAVPELYGMLLKYGGLGERSFENLRYMTVAGGALRHDLALEIAKRIVPATFHVMYGQSEASARLSVLPPEQLPLRPGSIGKPIVGVELAVLDEAGRELPSSAVGMLNARGRNIMLGYWEEAQATAEALSSDGWLKTGDLAHRDKDGYFYLDGRASLLVKIHGHRVHPAEIEKVVEECFPHTQAVAVPMARGEDTRFILFLASLGDQPIDLAEIRATCQREILPHKMPVHFEVLDGLPLTSGHKVDRAALAQFVPRIRAALRDRSPQARETVAAGAALAVGDQREGKFSDDFSNKPS